MATEEGLKSSTFITNESMSEYQYRLVQLSTTDVIKSVSASNQSVLGILQNDPASGEAAEVAYGGISKIEAGGTVGVGDYVGADSDGKGQTISGRVNQSVNATVASAMKIIGICTKGTSADGEVGSVMIDKQMIG